MIAPTDAQRRRALMAALYAAKPRARLIFCQPSGRLLLVAMALPDGTTELVRAETADAAELDSLSPSDRARAHSAFLALNQKETSDEA